jgi:hypothetical protein
MTTKINLIGSAATQQGMLKIIRSYFVGAKKISINHNNGTIHNTNGKIAGFRVVSVANMYRFEQLLNKGKSV